jgi:hypothetical protein
MAGISLVSIRQPSTIRINRLQPRGRVAYEEGSFPAFRRAPFSCIIDRRDAAMAPRRVSVHPPHHFLRIIVVLRVHTPDCNR